MVMGIDARSRGWTVGVTSAVLVGMSAYSGLPASAHAYPTISVADATVTEGDHGTKMLTFSVFVSGMHDRIVFSYSTSDASATARDDYKQRSETPTIGPWAFRTTFSIPILGDETAEPDETLTVTLSNPTNAIIEDGTAVGTIINDDAPAPVTTTSTDEAE